MYKLNNVTVVNTKKIKIGKESFDCKLKDTGIVYVARLTESRNELKIVFDEYNVAKTTSGFGITLISDAINVVTFNKAKKTMSNAELLKLMVSTPYNVEAHLRKVNEELCKKFADFETAIKTSDFVIVYGEDAAENFVRRYVAITKPLIYEQAPVVMDKLAKNLIPYIEKLDIVERVMMETSPANLAFQLENNRFDANINSDVLPLKVIQMLTKVGLDDVRVKKFAEYVSSGRGTIEEIETFFKWDAAIRKLYNKVSNWQSKNNAIFAAVYLLEYFTLTEMMTAVSNNLMYHNVIGDSSANIIFDALADIMAYRKVNEIADYTIPENIMDVYERTAKEYDIDSMPVRETFNVISREINRKYSGVIDGHGFVCPDDQHFFKRYTDRVNLLSKKNLNHFLDGKILIFAVGEETGIIFNSNVFAFDENGAIIPIIGTLSPEQNAAANTLWNKINERKI